MGIDTSGRTDYLATWRRPGGRGSWYAQSVAIELLEFLEEERDEEESLP
jgi:hypothetical protein